MTSFIPKTRAVIGDDLDVLREQLGYSTADACWEYGMPMTKWAKIKNDNAKAVVDNPTLAILVRQLSENPDLSPIPAAPSAQDALDMITTLWPEGIERKEFAILFGKEESSGYRWLKKNGNLSASVQRLFLVFSILLARSQDYGLSQTEMLDEWKSMVLHEGQQRGIENVFDSGQWTIGQIGAGSKPVICESLDALRDELGITSMDACWLFGLSMTKWSEMIRKTPSEPIENVTLALLVKALKKYPELSPLPQMPEALSVFESARKFRSDIDSRRFAIMFGCEESTGHRWTSKSAKVTPIVQRLMYVFMKRLTELESSGIDKIHEFLFAWDDIVTLEGRMRGIDDVYKNGRWTLQKK